MDANGAAVRAEVVVVGARLAAALDFASGTSGALGHAGATEREARTIYCIQQRRVCRIMGIHPPVLATARRLSEVVPSSTTVHVEYYIPLV